jgi:hypothetical protein
MIINPENQANSLRLPSDTTLCASMKKTPGYREFLLQLYESGFEICPHTPDPYTSNRSMINESLQEMRRYFYCESWIDHGYDNSPASNRENIVCDGNDAGSPFYSADLWKKYGIKNFWSSFYEDSSLFTPYNFYSSFSVPYEGWSQVFPIPEYWRHHKTGNFIHWRTNNTFEPKTEVLWSYLFNVQRLEELFQHRTNVIIHCYPARVDSLNAFYTITDDEIRVNAAFENVLKKLSSLQKNGRLWIPTVSQLIEYSLKLENVILIPNENKTYTVINNGKETIPGVTFSSQIKSVKAKNKTIHSKQAGQDVMFWFDLKAGEKVDLIFE